MTVPPEDFKLTNPQFDPIAKPDTKKENPHVLAMGMYQVDLIRGSMKGFDIVPGTDGEQMIAVIYDKKIDPQDTEEASARSRKFSKRGRRARGRLSRRRRWASSRRAASPRAGSVGVARVVQDWAAGIGGDDRAWDESLWRFRRLPVRRPARREGRRIRPHRTAGRGPQEAEGPGHDRDPGADGDGPRRDSPEEADRGTQAGTAPDEHG